MKKHIYDKRMKKDVKESNLMYNIFNIVWKNVFD